MHSRLPDNVEVLSVETFREVYCYAPPGLHLGDWSPERPALVRNPLASNALQHGLQASRGKLVVHHARQTHTIHPLRPPSQFVPWLAPGPLQFSRRPHKGMAPPNNAARSALCSAAPCIQETIVEPRTQSSANLPHTVSARRLQMK